jgi:uncharacterized protein
MLHVSPHSRPVTLITGASAGIGASLARVFADQGHEVVLIARRASKLEALADEIAQTAPRRPKILALDLTNRDAVEQIKRELAAGGLEPNYIVNNAGFGLVGEACELDCSEQLAMIALNIRALTALSLAFADSLSKLGGGILNVASVAGFVPGPGMAVYFATKAYVISFSEALYYELRQRGVAVTVLCPGPVPTEFQARAGIPRVPFPRRRGFAAAAGSPLLSCSADVVAKAGYAALMGRQRITVPGLGNKAVTLLMRLLPRRTFLEILGRSHLHPKRSTRVLARAVASAELARSE